MSAVSLARFGRDDLALLSRWLTEPHVARWWNDDPSAEAVDTQYGPSIDGRDRTNLFRIELDSSPVGFLQRYPLADEDDYARELIAVIPLSPGDYSLDYLIGEPNALRRGAGSTAVELAAAGLWVSHPEATRVLVPVHAANTASRRVLERAGFAAVAAGELEPDNPIDSRHHVIFALERHAHASTQDRNGRMLP